MKIPFIMDNLIDRSDESFYHLHRLEAGTESIILKSKEKLKMKKIRVGLIFGGRSGEHEVSLASAASVLKAIDKEKYEVVPIGITREGKWIVGGDPLKVLKEHTGYSDTLPATLLVNPETKGLLKLDNSKPDPTHLDSLDVIFPLLHGTYGEDGTVQGLLELADIPYVGAGVLASAVGMDKALMKSVFRDHGLPIVNFLVIKRKDLEKDPDTVWKQVEERLGYPCFVKPANLGSSVGVSKARDLADLRKALTLAAQYDRKIIVEQAINCREIECSVLGNDDPWVSVPGEVIPQGEFYDYTCKYTEGMMKFIIPAPLSPATQEEIQQIAIRAYLAIDCAGMARVDFFIDKETGKVYLNEINTIPGFTEMSAYPKLWEASGISYPELIDRLIQLAIERHKDKSRRIFNR
jgi:D-alanine-D-alanine ligase